MKSSLNYKRTPAPVRLALFLRPQPALRLRAAGQWPGVETGHKTQVKSLTRLLVVPRVRPGHPHSAWPLSLKLQTMNTTPIAFNGVNFEIVDRNGHPWLRSPQIAEALGYTQSNRVSDIYARNADEFTDSMTALVKLQTQGGVQDVRIFSLRGAHLIGMLARTAQAAAFRRWILDILESRPLPPLPYKEQPGQSLSEEQCAELRDMLTGAAAQVPSEMRRIFMVQGWSRLKAHFGCSYRQIPAERFDEATDLIARHVALYLPPAPEQAPAPQINLLDQRAMLHAFHAAQDWLTDVESFAGIDHEQKLPPDFPVINIGMTPEIIGLVSYALECAQFLLHWDASEGKFVIQQMHDREIVVDLDRLNAHAFAALVPESRLLEFLEAFLARKRKLESGEPHNG